MRKVLVTGAGGTVGSLLTEHLIAQNICVVAADRSEAGIANLMRVKLRLADPNMLDVQYGDLMNRQFVFQIIAGCDVVIHCAALKHVSVGVFFPSQLATENVTVYGNIIAAVQATESVEKILLCSSDKAAIPTSVMGASKYLLERMCQNVPRTRASFFAVRFGNILGSSGSLSEVVARCIENTTPFLLTDILMTRYILKKSELLSLIEHTLAKAENGEIWTMNLVSAKVIDLVQVFSELLGKGPPEIQVSNNVYFENIAEALFNEAEIKNVRQEDSFLIFNQKRKGNLIEEISKNAISSSKSTLDIEALRKHLSE